MPLADPIPDLAAEKLTPALLAVATQFEAAYRAGTDLHSKIDVLVGIDEIPPAAAAEALWRLFFVEQDIELREEILNSLPDIEGENQSKLDLLAAALQPEQPQTIRLTAVDLLVELGDPQAIPILQNYWADADKEIQEATNDAVEELQTQDAPTAPPPPPLPAPSPQKRQSTGTSQ